MFLYRGIFTFKQDRDMSTFTVINALGLFPGYIYGGPQGFEILHT